MFLMVMNQKIMKFALILLQEPKSPKIVIFVNIFDILVDFRYFLPYRSMQMNKINNIMVGIRLNGGVFDSHKTRVLR